MNTIRIKLNKDIGKFKKEEVLKLRVDEYGNAYDPFWFRRMKDAKIDNCLEILEEKENKTGLKTKKSKKNKED